MQELKDRILRDGIIKRGGVLRVDSFLNQQLDVGLIDRIGAEFAKEFGGSGATKILSIEASGIAIAFAMARVMGLPLVYAKKHASRNLSDDVYKSTVYSFTRMSNTDIYVSKEYISKDDKIIIIDDFLANGSALSGLVDIVNMAGAELIGCGVVIEKAFQGGGNALRERGIRVCSLAKIISMEDNDIVFE